MNRTAPAGFFLRLRGDGQRLVALINPRNQPENLAWSYIRNHLDAIGIPVGRLYASDLESGFFLMEDMGPELLHDKVLAANRDPGAIERLYLPVLGMLARLQARGARSFDFFGFALTARSWTPPFCAPGNWTTSRPGSCLKAAA